ncbi:hypothetical protein NMY22_g19829 [Coprinellus aureogranulatus]|nr:hypothetical protein NMY22_g19829 [Coprinellus aureogranulatus]
MFTSAGGVGNITQIPYQQDNEAYREYLAKRWDDPRIKAIVRRWNERLFPTYAASQGEDLTSEIEQSMANCTMDDSVDAMIARTTLPPPGTEHEVPTYSTEKEVEQDESEEEEEEEEEFITGNARSVSHLTMVHLLTALLYA